MTPPQHIERLFPLLAAVGEHAAVPADSSIIEEEMDLIGTVMVGDLVTKSFDPRRVGHIGEMCRDPQALRQCVAPSRCLFVAGSAYDRFGTGNLGLPTYWHDRVGMMPPVGVPTPIAHHRSLYPLLDVVPGDELMQRQPAEALANWTMRFGTAKRI